VVLPALLQLFVVFGVKKNRNETKEATNEREQLAL
jgi:hypothetical protein